MAMDPTIKAKIISDWNQAPYKEKTKTLKKWAKLVGCHYNTLRRQMPTDRKRKKTGPKIGGLDDYVDIVFQIKKKPPAQRGEITTEQALWIAVENGRIPAEMKGKVSTFDRRAMELGLNRRVRRFQRFQADSPNQLHHVDASSSKCFYVASELPDGEFILKLHAGTTGYKNKPVPIRLRPWVYGLVDDCSGYAVARYVVAYGETAVDNLDFLVWAWAKNDDKPFFGIPDKLKGDLGPMMRGPASKDFFARLGIEINPSSPENKESHGKIERPWRTTWQRFETPFFVQPDWRKFEIPLSELNRRFLNYQQEYNLRRHRYEKSISRLDAWKRINQRGGAVAIPENALATIARRAERTVGADGCFTVDNVIYEVKGLHAAKVNVYLGVFDDKIVVENKADGQKYEVEKFSPNPVGIYTAHKETPHQKAVKAAQSLEVENTLYQNPIDQGNVTQFPTRIKETRNIENPLVVDAYPSVSDAMQEFTSLCGFQLDAESREAIKRRIIQNGLSRKYVTNLAYECQIDEDEKECKNG